MILSVIIVNYQVRYFLELCLYSVEKAVRGLDAEIIVVDNHSNDGSLEYLRPRFPNISFLANTVNKGFAGANNQALEQASGQYILFLNPDTILPEDIAVRCLSFLADTPRIGGLGVRMIDGGGHFLKESRRGFPTPWVGFCRLSGLSTLFPRSRHFAAYYLGHLPADKAHPAPILSGACLWVSRAILEEIGSFDEQFFLYAEDIDLSFRIEQAGYTNYYFPSATIVHFKGESTRKDGRYVRQFYYAMRQFRRKHFKRGLPAFFDLGVQGAIRLRAGIAAVAGALRQITAPGRNGTGTAGTTNGNSVCTVLRGDNREARRVKSLLEASGKRRVVEEIGQGDEVLLCEGEDFSFRESIVGLEELAKEGKEGRQIKFHAGGSGSAVGSPDRNGQGEVLIL